jgi:hypothetical protein
MNNREKSSEIQENSPINHNVKNNSKAQTTVLQAYPPLMDECFSLLKAAGAERFALFGGSIRDSDYGARQGVAVSIKDYDLRIWLEEEGYEESLKVLIGRMEELAGLKFAVLPVPVNQVHYVGIFQGAELDVSVRPVKALASMRVEAVAVERAAKCDVGISAAAIDSSGQAWVTPAYLYDHTHNTLTVSSRNNLERRTIYANRMLAKYPGRVLRIESEFRSDLTFFRSENVVSGSTGIVEHVAPRPER